MGQTLIAEGVSLVHSSSREYLLSTGTTVDDVAMNIAYEFLFKALPSILSGMYVEVNCWIIR
jgi:hypothetical protein